jgi:hypothetical protein
LRRERRAWMTERESLLQAHQNLEHEFEVANNDRNSLIQIQWASLESIEQSVAKSGALDSENAELKRRLEDLTLLASEQSAKLNTFQHGQIERLSSVPAADQSQQLASPGFSKYLRPSTGSSELNQSRLLEAKEAETKRLLIDWEFQRIFLNESMQLTNERVTQSIIMTKVFCMFRATMDRQRLIRKFTSGIVGGLNNKLKSIHFKGWVEYARATAGRRKWMKRANGQVEQQTMIRDHVSLKSSFTELATWCTTEKAIQGRLQARADRFRTKINWVVQLTTGALHNLMQNTKIEKAESRRCKLALKQVFASWNERNLASKKDMRLVPKFLSVMDHLGKCTKLRNILLKWGAVASKSKATNELFCSAWDRRVVNVLKEWSKHAKAMASLQLEIPIGESEFASVFSRISLGMPNRQIEQDHVPFPPFDPVTPAFNRLVRAESADESDQSDAVMQTITSLMHSLSTSVLNLCMNSEITVPEVSAYPDFKNTIQYYVEQLYLRDIAGIMGLEPVDSMFGQHFTPTDLEIGHVGKYLQCTSTGWDADDACPYAILIMLCARKEHGISIWDRQMPSVGCVRSDFQSPLPLPRQSILKPPSSFSSPAHNVSFASPQSSQAPPQPASFTPSTPLPPAGSRMILPTVDQFGNPIYNDY